MNQASGFCEWNGPPETPPPLGRRTTIGAARPSAPVQLAGDVDELVEGAGDEVGELHLADRPHADDRGADRAADHRLLGDRRVDHAVGPELLLQAGGHLERAAEGADVLAEQQHALVLAQRHAQRVGDRLQVGELASRRGAKRLHGAAPRPERPAARPRRRRPSSGARRAPAPPSPAPRGSPRRPPREPPRRSPRRRRRAPAGARAGARSGRAPPSARRPPRGT